MAKVYLSTMVARKVKQDIQKQAKLENRSVSNLVEIFLREGVNTRKKSGKVLPRPAMHAKAA